ncbi:quinon protein alcohol dehydrogenase-like superfamily [Podospora didyma]|uniref:Quinon protein alcohol dehydrogenase-like superfamily n=1 Tax=Podospora didyma TaxID=330526 RepID=A0AAE0U1Q0_9PEZI|nr:quinon protein alcohol dehydrogenase-like superfamily [Podospora didyma]
MASTPSNRLKLTPANSPFLSRPSRSPVRGRTVTSYDTCLSLRRIVGTTCSSPTGFDTVHSSFAYIAGGAVVVVDVSGEHYAQRFYRARPAAIPVFAVSPIAHDSATPNSTPKANDSRNRAAASPRDSLYGGGSGWSSDSPSSKTWTSRERIKAATCLGLSRDGRYLAVGETGYAPRVLIFSLQDSSSDTPLVSISEHTYGVKAVAWSPDTKYLASLGTANDGFLYLWKIDPGTGAAKLFQQNRCTSHVKGMVWIGNSLVTFGVRHVKMWRVEEGPAISPTKQRFDGSYPAAQQAQKPLAGRNILLGTMIEATFGCAVAVGDNKAIICSETGSVCLLDDTNKQMKLVRIVDLGFNVSCISSRNDEVFIGGKEGQFTVLRLDGILEGTPDPTIHNPQSSNGLIAMGFLAENLVTIDTKRSIDVWSPDHIPAGSKDDQNHIPIPGPGDPIVGIQRLSGTNSLGASFFTWSASGKVHVWDLEGMIRSSFGIPIEYTDPGSDTEPFNQLVVVRATDNGSLFVAGDKLGVLRIVEASTRACLLETKAHSSDIQDIAIFEGTSKVLVASCGRDRTVQLFHRSSTRAFEHFQTLEFTAKVVQVFIPSEDKILTCSLDRTLQVHDLIAKDGEPDIMAAVPLKLISLRASPSSMVMTPDEKTVFVSLLDRSVCQFDLTTGRLSGTFKCNDEGGLESVVLESLTHGHYAPGDITFLLGISNTDKSVRLYDAQSGSFMDREWGHTEAINGVVMIDSDELGRKVVSVGEDGTIMIWALDLQDHATGGSRTRDPSPEKTLSLTAHRPPLRRVLSKAELAEFQRPTSNAGRRSPPRPLQRRASKFPLMPSMTRTPVAEKQISPRSAVAESTPSRRASSGGGSRSGSPPPESPKGRPRILRRPSLPALHMTPPSGIVTSRKKSSSNLRGNYGFGSLSMATEQTCRQLRAYRKKLSSTDSINSDVLAELDAELRLTAAALGERAIRSRSSREPERGKAVSETMLSSLLDEYSERLVTMLDEKLRLRLSEEEKDALIRERPRTAGEGSTSGSNSGVLCEEPSSL